MYEYYFGYRIFTSITTFKFAMCSCKKCNADDLLIKLLFAEFKAISFKNVSYSERERNKCQR